MGGNTSVDISLLPPNIYIFKIVNKSVKFAKID